MKGDFSIQRGSPYRQPPHLSPVCGHREKAPLPPPLQHQELGLWGSEDGVQFGPHSLALGKDSPDTLDSSTHTCTTQVSNSSCRGTGNTGGSFYCISQGAVGCMWGVPQHQMLCWKATPGQGSMGSGWPPAPNPPPLGRQTCCSSPLSPHDSCRLLLPCLKT